MEKSQYNLCIEVLRRFAKANILNNIILIGSWCIPFYKEYFREVEYIPTIKTRDIDFLIPSPSRIKTKVDIPELLEDLGFVINFLGSKGYIRLEHQELMIEFLIPEKGKGSDKPYPLPQLGLNAQPIRMLNMLTDNTIKVKVKDIPVFLPHPAYFALHKLMISARRSKREKSARDKIASLEILRALINKGEIDTIINVLDSIPVKWKKKILKVLVNEREHEILKLVHQS